MATAPLTIRPARDVDEAALRRLAALDSTIPLRGDVLLAEEDGEMRAALSLADGRVVADPFRLTSGIVAALRARVPRHAAAAEPAPRRPRVRVLRAAPR